MTVRAWGEEDLPMIESIETECFQDPWCEAMWKGTFTRKDFVGVLIEENGEVLGFAGGTALFEDSELLRIAVKKSSRGKGYGGRLLDELCQAVKTRGAEKMFLEVRASNRTAQALYQSRGFTVTGTRHKYYADGEDAYLMQKIL